MRVLVENASMLSVPGSVAVVEPYHNFGLTFYASCVT
jgi:hypothetical protein